MHAGLVVAQHRPGTTEDPAPIGEGLIRLEAGVSHVWDQPYPVSGLAGNLLGGPALGVGIGVGPHAEIQIEGISFNRLGITDRGPAPLSHMVDVTGDSTRSFDDVVVGAKVRVVGEGARRPAIALRFATRLPNASNESGLGLDTIDFFQSLLVGKTVRAVRAVANVGVGILSDPTRGDRQNDVLTYGVSIVGTLTGTVAVVGDINGRVSTRRGEPPPGTGTRGTTTVGLRYTRGAVTIDGGLLVGATSRDADVGFTAGLTWVFESPLDP